MIFYFSGTGNSYDAALRLRDEDERLIDIKDAVWNREFWFEPEENEAVGFVFPVYFAGLPTIVNYFLKHVDFSVIPSYTYVVATCGGSAMNACGMAADVLGRNGYAVRAAYTVTMPDNYVVMFTIPSEEEQEKILTKAHESLDEIRRSVLARRRNRVYASLPKRAATAAMYNFYRFGRSTKEFYTDDKCVGCGVCAGRCPAKAIRMIDGHPVWIKDQCIHCMSCVRCNAIQYGDKLKDKARYKNPVLKKCH